MTHSEDPITGSETRESDTIDGGLVKDGRRVADTLRDVAREVKESNDGLGGETATKMVSRVGWDQGRDVPNESFPDSLEESGGSSSLSTFEGLGLNVTLSAIARRGREMRRTASPSSPLATLVTNDVAPAVTPYRACLGLFLNCRMRR